MEEEMGRSLRTYTRKNYDDNLDDEIEGKRTFNVLEKLHDPKFRQGSFVQKLPNGNDINLKYVQEHGFESPFLFESREGLGMRMPPSDFTVEDVKNFVGARRVVDVIDVNTQQQIEMSMLQFAKYYMNTEREKIYNVISLEFSHTRLENHVETPLLVRQLDWVDNVWPKELIRQQRDSTNNMDDMKYPKVRKYVLMSVSESYTDFHIDFCGSSVWYHIVKGRKVFWLIPPTTKNLNIYENWVLSGKQQDVFLGDQVEKCYLVEMAAGNTFFMPSGWIHAVYTPEDSLVFGGNFIHCFNIENQFKICDIEESTRVPKKFRYPLHTEIMWYLVKQYVSLLERDQQECKKESGTSNDVNGDGTKVDPGGRPRRSGRERTKTGEENKENVEKKVEVEMNGDGTEGVNGDTGGEAVTKSAPTKPWMPVHLTSREVTGLELVVTRMKEWSKTNIPDGIENPDQLLNRLQELLEQQKGHDPVLTVSGVHYMKQIIVDDEGDGVRKSKSLRKVRKPSSSLRRRRVRCRACEACTREDCTECRYCKDMKKFGGPGVLKQSCMLRQCQDPTLPSTAMCKICEENHPDDDQTLMECAKCSKIVHPTCMPAKGYYHIVPDINNCWKCPECCDKHSGERFNGQRLPARRSVAELKASEKASPSGGRTSKRKRDSDGSTGSPDDEDMDSDGNTSDEDSAPLAVLAKKRRPSPPAIPFAPPLEVAATYIIRPRPSSPPPETFELENGGTHIMKRDTWLKVFGYLTQHELSTCMAVSRTWNRWCMDKRFWTRIKLSVGRPITASALYGVVRRQPLTLDLSHTNITQQQLAWFLSRLPRLRDLILGATTFATVSAFTRVTCPPLKLLDLSWSEKITDQLIDDLLKPSTNGRRERSPGPGENTSRLRYLTELGLAGCEITDVGLRSIKRHLGCLTRLDLSYNILITDQGLANLLDTDSDFHKHIKEMNLAGCSNLSDACLEALKKAPELDKLDVRKCDNITASACEALKTMRTTLSVVQSK